MEDFPPPTVHPPRNALPVLLSIPHAGCEYPEDILARATQGKLCLEPLEDPLVDRLAWRAIKSGTGAVVQTVPRAVIDCNRNEDETDPASIVGVSPSPVGTKARFGLGIVPSRTRKHGTLWRRPIERAEFQHRIEQVHRPYHDAIQRELDRMVIAHGVAVLIDLHSMPPRPSGCAQIVIGNRHGTTSADWLGNLAAAITREEGLTAALNDPYPGGAIVEQHGQPSANIHALQIELDRRLYLDADLRSAGRGFNRMALFVERLITELGKAAADEGFARAAE